MEKFKGLFTALITPFSGGQVDFDSLEKLVKHQIQNGVDGFVINGTTAESPCLKKEEIRDIFKTVKAISGKKMPLIVGSGTNCTETTIEYSQLAESLGADAILVVVPYYNKPPQRGLEKHFTVVANAVGCPVILYNVPSRTITSLSLETISNLNRVKNIVGLKEASGKIDFAKDILATCNKEFILLSGDDGTYFDFLEAGGHGVISVASHVIPKKFSEYTHNKRTPEMEEDFQSQRDLIDMLFCEANPIPVKKALQIMGLIKSAELRLPLVELGADKARELEKVMQTSGVI